MDNPPFYIGALIVILCLLLMIVHYELKNNRALTIYTKNHPKQLKEITPEELLFDLINRMEKLESHLKLDKDDN